MKAAGFRHAEQPRRHQSAPACVRKSGSGFDLPIAIAYLLATRQVNPSFVEETLAVGELALDGAVRRVDGLFAYAIAAQEGSSAVAIGFRCDVHAQAHGARSRVHRSPCPAALGFVFATGYACGGAR